MALGTLSRRILLIVVVVLFLAIATLGIKGGMHELPNSQSPGQIAQGTAQLLYGVLAVLSVAARLWAPRWMRILLAAWVISVALAAGLAPVVWGQTSLLVGILSGAAGLVVAAGLAWALQLGSR